MQDSWAHGSPDCEESASVQGLEFMFSDQMPTPETQVLASGSLGIKHRAVSSNVGAQRQSGVRKHSIITPNGNRTCRIELFAPSSRSQELSIWVWLLGGLPMSLKDLIDSRMRVHHHTPTYHGEQQLSAMVNLHPPGHSVQAE